MSRFFNQKKLYGNTNEQLAWHIHNLLNGYGLKTEVHNDKLPDVVLPRLIVPFEVWVKEDQYDEALVILDKILAPETEDTGTWTCATCHEQIGGQFTECWNCGNSRNQS